MQYLPRYRPFGENLRKGTGRIPLTLQDVARRTAHDITVQNRLSLLTLALANGKSPYDQSRCQASLLVFVTL